MINCWCGLDEGELEEPAASVSAAGSPEPASAESSGTEPWPPSRGRMASVHHSGGLRLVDPPGSRHLSSRFLGRGGDVATWPLLTRTEAVGLLLDEVNDGLA
jgi:hypothetical protein